MRQSKLIKKNDTAKQHTTISAGSTVAVQREDSGPWVNRTITEHGDEEHTGWYSKICITKMGRIVTKNSQHIS